MFAHIFGGRRRSWSLVPALKLEPRKRFKQKRSEWVLEKKGVINVGVAVLLKLHRPNVAST